MPTSRQTSAVAVSVGLLGLDIAGPVWLLGLVAVADAVLGSALGLFVSAFARTEFQAVQFMPALVLPQLLLCGLFIARDQMAPLLYDISWALPFTYAYDALARATTPDALGPEIVLDAAVIAATTATLLGLGAATLRRRTA